MKKYIMPLFFLSMLCSKINAQNVDSLTFFQQYAGLVNGEEPASYEEITSINTGRTPLDYIHLEKCVNLGRLVLNSYEPHDLKKLFKILADKPSFGVLWLVNLPMDSIPDEIHLLKKMIGLNIWKCDSLKYISPKVNSIKSLQMLNIANCNQLVIKDVWSVVVQNKYITVLYLTDLNFTKIPKRVGEMKNLVHLNVSGNAFAKIPKAILKCNKLEKVNLSWNRSLIKIPCWLNQLKSVKEIHVGATEVKVVLSCLKGLVIGTPL